MAPFVIGLAWTLALGAAALFIARLLHRRLPTRRRALEGAAIGAAGSFGLLFLYQNVLVHDALWYYGYLRSALVDRSFELYDEFVLMNPFGMYLPPPETPPIHLGTALFEAPAALLVRPLAIMLSRMGIVPGGDGFGPLEIGAATWTSLMLGIGGVALVHRLARPVCGGSASTLAQVALLYASPLAFFTFTWPAYPHAATVFLGALFLLVWYRGERPFLLGLLGGLLALVHPQDILYLALPGIDLLLTRGPLASRLRRGGWIAFGTLLGFAPQVAVWLPTAGTPLAHVYVDIGDPFIWTRPAFGAVLFSGYNGLLSWTPLCGAAIAGLFFLRRSHPRLFRGLLLLLVLEWWAIASYGYWWGGASFGARYFLSAYPVMGVGLAALLERLARRVGMLAAGLCAMPFVYWNLLLMAQFRLEWIPHNQRPDFIEILRRQLFEAPQMLFAGLSGTLGWNQVFFVELFHAAWNSGSVARLAVWVLLATLLVFLLLAWVGWLGLGERVPGRRSGNAWAVVGATAATLAVAWVASAPGFGERRLLREAIDVPLRIAPETVRLIPLGRGPEPPTAVRIDAGASFAGERRSLDLISFLHNAEKRTTGEQIALLEVHGSGCDHQALAVRAGIETAETAPHRVEVVASMSHGIENTRVIQSWWQENNSAFHYWGHAYLASWDLPAGCEPREVEIRTAGGAGDFEIQRLVVATYVKP